MRSTNFDEEHDQERPSFDERMRKRKEAKEKPSPPSEPLRAEPASPPRQEPK